MKFTPELEILIESIKVSLLEHPTNRFNYLLHNESINWQRLEKMAQYNAIRPLLYDAFQKIGFKHSYVEKLKVFCLEQTVVNLTNQAEVEQLGQLLSKHKIRVLNYKGVLFNKEIYGSNAYREAGDIDMLFHPDDAQMALEVLFKNGYRWSEKVRNQSYTVENIHEILNYIGREVDLKKGSFCLDFHWGLFENYRYINYDIEDLFEKNNGGFSTSIEKIIFLLLVHHAGRECWVKLKYLADFIMFLKKYNHEIKWATFMNQLDKYNLKEPTCFGLIMVAKLTSQQIPDGLEDDWVKFEKNTKTQDLIIDFWEKSNDLLSIRSKIHYLKIYRRLQDPDFSMIKYLIKYFKANSIPNPIEQKRIITFPDNYPFLNFISKAITIFLRKTT